MKSVVELESCITYQKKKSSIKMQQAPKRPPRTWRGSVESTSIKKGSTGFYFIKQTEPRNMKRKAPKQTTTNEYKWTHRHTSQREFILIWMQSLLPSCDGRHTYTHTDIDTQRNENELDAESETCIDCRKLITVIGFGYFRFASNPTDVIWSPKFWCRLSAFQLFSFSQQFDSIDSN